MLDDATSFRRLTLMLNRHHLYLNYSNLQEMLAELQQAAERPETGINYQVKGNEIL
ncbi:MAG: hypothetical protein ACFCBU_05720 [Cyanophyceae cyanobacterium]